MLKVKIIFLSILLIALAGCATITKNFGISYTAGIYIYPEKLAQIKPGISQKDVFELIGSPSFTSTFSNNTWFYVYQKTWYIATFREKLVNQQILILSFNNNGILTKVEQKNLKDSHIFSFDEKETFFYYKKIFINPDLF